MDGMEGVEALTEGLIMSVVQKRLRFNVQTVGNAVTLQLVDIGATQEQQYVIASEKLVVSVLPPPPPPNPPPPPPAPVPIVSIYRG